MIRLLNESDRGIVVEYLQRNHIECTFLIGNVEYFGINNNKSLRRCGDYFGYFENGSLKGILPFYNLGSCIPHFESKNALPEFINIMKERNFKYLLGMKKFISPLYDGINENKITLNFSDNSYFVNDNFKEFILPDVKFVDARKFDIDKAIDFIYEAKDKGFGEKSSREDIYNTIKQIPDDENFIFAVMDGKIVAEACIQTTTSLINQIGGVYTTKDERGKGYCKAVVSELCRIIIEKDKLPTLMVRNNNTPAVKAYTSLGFRYYDDYSLITLKD